MAVVSTSAVKFFERTGHRSAEAYPLPTFDGGAIRKRTLPLVKQPPVPGLTLDAEGSPPPDRGTTQDWPPDGNAAAGHV